MKIKRIEIIIAAVLVYLIFCFIFPNYRESKYVGSNQFYEKVVDNKAGILQQTSLEAYGLSWLSKKYMKYMGSYVVKFHANGEMEIDDMILREFETKRYRVSPLGVVYKDKLIPYGVIVGNKLYTLYDWQFVYLEGTIENTGWENYQQATDELMNTV